MGLELATYIRQLYTLLDESIISQEQFDDLIAIGGRIAIDAGDNCDPDLASRVSRHMVHAMKLRESTIFNGLIAE